MAEKTKIILTSACRFRGEHHAMGEILEVNIDLKADADLVAMLTHAGRIALATPDTVEAVQAEAENIARHEEHGRAQAELAKREAEISARERALELDKREAKLIEAERKAAAAAGEK